MDEGAEGPGIAIIASVSGTITALGVITHEYIRSMKASLRRKPKTPSADDPEKGLDSHGTSSTTGNPEKKDDSGSSSISPSPGAGYSSAHIDMVAYRMATGNLDPKNSRSIARGLHLGRTIAANSQPLYVKKNRKNPENRSRLMNVTSNTAHFGINVARFLGKSPVAFFYNVANGFHNQPGYIFHDDTVRRRINITGFSSGCKAAGKGFTYGIWDGVTGVVSQPVHGAKKEGIKGFGKGMAKGGAGLILKLLAGKLPPYTGASQYPTFFFTMSLMLYQPSSLSLDIHSKV